MPLRAQPMTLGLSTSRQDNNISMAEDDLTLDLQMITMKTLREIVNQMNNNTQALDNKINEIRIAKVKLLFIKCFDGTRLKLKGFLL